MKVICVKQRLPSPLIPSNAPGFFDVVYLNNQVLLTNFSVPEPATLQLLGIAGLLLVTRRRRRQQG